MKIVVDTNVLISGVFFGGLPRKILTFIVNQKIIACATTEIIDPITHIEICRDPDDNKFLECAKDSHAIYIVSGDKDLLIIKEYENIQIVTAKDFCEKFL